MSVPYLTATRDRVTVNQNLQLGSSNVMLDRYGNQMWVPGSTVQWQPTPGPPVVTPPAGFSAATSYAGGTYRWVGNEIVYNVNTQTTVAAVGATRTADYTLSVPYPVSTAAYGGSNVVVGDLWMYVMTAGTVLTFKAYARTQAADANNVTLRFLSGSTDDTLASIDAGSAFTLQGSLTYVTTSVNGGAGLIPPYVVPVGFTQNQLGQVLLNGSSTSFQPRAQLDVATSSNVPGLIVDQRSAGTTNDVVDFMIGGVKTVVIDGTGNVGIGTSQPQFNLHVAGNLQRTTYAFAATMSASSGYMSASITVPFNTLTVDDSSGYNTTTYTYTVPRNGIYFLGFNIGISSASGLLSNSFADMRVTRSGTTTAHARVSFNFSNTTSDRYSATATTILSLTTGNTIRVYAVGSTANGNYAFIDNMQNLNTFYGYLINPL